MYINLESKNNNQRLSWLKHYGICLGWQEKIKMPGLYEYITKKLLHFFNHRRLIVCYVYNYSFSPILIITSKNELDRIANDSYDSRERYYFLISYNKIKKFLDIEDSDLLEYGFKNKQMYDKID